MSKTKVIYGFSSANEKYKLLVQIKEFYGATDKETYFHGIVKGYKVCLSYCETKPLLKPDFDFLSVDEFIKLYNDAIPLTDWQSGNPEHVGEYNASYETNKRDDSRRYWGGVYWSLYYCASDTQENKNNFASTKRMLGIKIVWRGLSKQPLTR